MKLAKATNTAWAKCAIGLAIIAMIVLGIETSRYVQIAPEWTDTDIAVKLVFLVCIVLLGSAFGMFFRKPFALSIALFILSGIASCIAIIGLESNIRSYERYYGDLELIGMRHELELQVEEAQAEAAAAKAELSAFKANVAKRKKSESTGGDAKPTAKASSSQQSSTADNVASYLKLAEQGDKDAQYRLARRYDLGYGVAEDKSQAVYWYRKAAEQGHAEAQCCLGTCYDFGYGVAEDKSQAVYWYGKAAEQGDAEAQYNLGVCYYNGEGIAEDESQAVYWFRKAAKQGVADAQFSLGFCYYFGYGVAEDESQAVYWFRKAAEQGIEEAKQFLD